MSGMMPSNDPQPLMSETPQALTDLARSLEGEVPSPHVEQALDAAWEAMHASTDPRQANHRWQPWPAWALPALAVAAALLVTAAGVGWVTPARGGPDDPEPVGVAAAVPGGPFEPPPQRAPADERPPSRPDQGVDRPASSRRDVPPSQTAPSPRPNVRPRVDARPAQVVSAEDPEPFIWLRGADEIEPGLGVHLVRVQVPHLRWDAGTPRRELVDADVLMGNDGQARAVRVVRTGNR